MINVRWERALFIILFVVCLVIVGMQFIQIKATLPINAGMTPEQVIKVTYPKIVQDDRNYKYTIIDDYLFLCVETKPGYYDFDIGYRNDQSGFILELPGLVTGDIYKKEHKVVPLNGHRNIYVGVRRYFKSDFVITIIPININDIEFFSNDIKMESIYGDWNDDTRWIDVIDLSKDIEIHAVSKGEKIYVINLDEIREMFGES